MYDVENDCYVIQINTEDEMKLSMKEAVDNNNFQLLQQVI